MAAPQMAISYIIQKPCCHLTQLTNKTHILLSEKNKTSIGYRSGVDDLEDKSYEWQRAKRSTQMVILKT